MTDNLPPLPVPYGQGFTDEQMRNYANAAIDAALAARGAVPAGWREAMTNLLWAATERDKKNRIRQFDEFVDAARELLATAPQQVAQPVQPTLLRDLAEELGMSVPALAGAISRKGLGYYSTNMEVTNDVIGAMRADFTQAKPEQAAQPWMPIETAPKDGTRVLLVIDHGKWGDKIWTGLWADRWMVSYGKTSNPPTHWMPLPAAPQKPKD